jgi:hypothetical protein
MDSICNLIGIIPRQYYVPAHQYQVVEVPILESNLSQFKSKVESNSLDSIPFQAIAPLKQAARYLFVFNEQANELINSSIIKICPSSTSSQALESLFYNTINANFEGQVLFSNNRDSVLKAYYYKNGFWSETGFQESLFSGSQDRWGCTIGYLDFLCTGDGHTWSERNICKCGQECCPNCLPPRMVPIMSECNAWVSGGGTSLPPPPSIPIGGNNGSSGGSGGSGPSTGCQCKSPYTSVYIHNFEAIFGGAIPNYWFNCWDAIAANCSNGVISSSALVVLPVNGSSLSNPERYVIDIDQTFTATSKTKIGPCTWRIKSSRVAYVSIYYVFGVVTVGSEEQVQHIHLVENTVHIVE